MSHVILAERNSKYPVWPNVPVRRWSGPRRRSLVQEIQVPWIHELKVLARLMNPYPALLQNKASQKRPDSPNRDRMPVGFDGIGHPQIMKTPERLKQG